MTKFYCAALLLLLVGAAFAAPTKEDDGPVEIDFTPLPGMGDQTEYRLHLTLKDASGEGLAQGYKIGANTDPVDVAELVLGSLPDGFQAKRDGAKLIVTSFSDKPIKTVTVKAEGLPKGFNPPKVRRLPKKK